MDVRRPDVLPALEAHLKLVPRGVDHASLSLAVNEIKRLRTKLTQCALELQEAGRLLREKYPGCASIFFQAADVALDRRSGPIRATDAEIKEELRNEIQASGDC